jgi:predicted Zn-dependent peptidase
MRRVLIVLVLIAGAAYYIYNRSQLARSDEVFKVKNIQERFALALNRFTSAAGRSGIIGIDTTFDTEATVKQIEDIRKELAELRRSLTEPAAISRAEKLSEKIEYFCKQNNIIQP